ncbi:MAG: hypothetical protein AAFX80_13490 [Cyanobacteria bacterium J06639_18]
MKLFNKLAIAAVSLVLGCSAIPGQASAASFEMVTNGEFEEAQGTSDWFIAPNLRDFQGINYPKIINSSDYFRMIIIAMGLRTRNPFLSQNMHENVCT